MSARTRLIKNFGGVPIPSIIYAVGNSLTAGNQWMALLQAQLTSYIYYNFAQNGAQIPAVVAQYTDKVAPGFNSRRPQRIVFIFMGTNDMVGNTAEDLYPQFVSLASEVKADGNLPIIVSVPPSTAFSAGVETQRGLLNGMLAAGWQDFADGYADITSVPQTNDASNPTYYPDGTHPSQALYELWEPVMQDAVESLQVAA